MFSLLTCFTESCFLLETKCCLRSKNLITRILVVKQTFTCTLVAKLLLEFLFRYVFLIVSLTNYVIDGSLILHFRFNLVIRTLVPWCPPTFLQTRETEFKYSIIYDQWPFVCSTFFIWSKLTLSYCNLRLKYAKINQKKGQYPPNVT